MKWQDKVRKTFPSHEKAREFISHMPDRVNLFKEISSEVLRRKLDDGFVLIGEHKTDYVHIVEIISGAPDYMENGGAYIEMGFSAEIEPIAESAA